MSEGNVVSDRLHGTMLAPCGPTAAPGERILVVEDDGETAASIGACLAGLGFRISIAADGAEGLRRAVEGRFDAVILDRLLPKLDGLSVLERLRKSGIDVPVLVLTALGRVDDRVAGLDAGADDYLVKPFAIAELVARINVALRRRSSRDSSATRLIAGPLRLDLLTREVHRDGASVRLQPREFRLLEELVRYAGTCITRSMLLERIWSFQFDPGTKIVETHISRLRTKLNEGGLPDLIETVRNSGYRFRSC